MQYEESRRLVESESRRLAESVAEVAEYSARVHEDSARVHEGMSGRRLEPEALREHAQRDRELAAAERARARGGAPEPPEPGA